MRNTFSNNFKSSLFGQAIKNLAGFTALFLVLAVLFSMLLYACGGSTTNNDPTIDFDSSEREEEILQQYFKTNKLNPQKHSTGFYYLINTSTGGMKGSTGDTLYSFFKGNVLYSKTFVDSSKVRYPNDPISYRLNVITTFPSFKNKQGFHDATALLGVREKGTFFFPSRLMYGKAGALGAFIPPNTPIVYEIEVSDIRKQ
jgi:FKBP-type peptidyl-prolyl cis-trans isomerase